MGNRPSFTPGPWEISALGRIITTKDHVPVARTANLADADEQRDNAILIAAAPELFEVLAEVADYWAGGDVPEELDDRMRDLLWRIQGRRVTPKHTTASKPQATDPCHDETGHLRAEF